MPKENKKAVFKAFPLTIAYCESAAALHQTGFDFPWSVSSFHSLLSLSTTVGWINEKSLLVCSQVGDEMEILTLCVLPDFRRQGIAESCMDFLFQYAKKHQIQRIFLEVSIQNIAAQNLYLKKGFQKIGCRKNYYKTRAGFCDALCMEKILND